MKKRGWVCPKCHRVYSPYTTKCEHCGGTSESLSHNNYGIALKNDLEKRIQERIKDE